MNSHDNKIIKQGAHKHSPIKHLLHMALCCGLPIVIIGFLPLMARFSPAAGGVVGKIAPFLCPIMMMMMMPIMLRKDKKGSCCDDTNEKHDDGKPLELNKAIE